MFCKECGSLMFPMEGKWVCKRCSSTTDSVGKLPTKVVTKSLDKEMLITEGEGGTLPKTKVECPKCAHNEAYWVIRQTRAADEPETRIYQCTKCKHKWREY